MTDETGLFLLLYFLCTMLTSIFCVLLAIRLALSFHCHTQTHRVAFSLSLSPSSPSILYSRSVVDHSFPSAPDCRLSLRPSAWPGIVQNEHGIAGELGYELTLHRKKKMTLSSDQARDSNGVTPTLPLTCFCTNRVLSNRLSPEKETRD